VHTRRQRRDEVLTALVGDHRLLALQRRRRRDDRRAHGRLAARSLVADDAAHAAGRRRRLRECGRATEHERRNHDCCKWLPHVPKLEGVVVEQRAISSRRCAENTAETTAGPAFADPVPKQRSTSVRVTVLDTASDTRITTSRGPFGTVRAFS